MDVAFRAAGWVVVVLPEFTFSCRKGQLTPFLHPAAEVKKAHGFSEDGRASPLANSKYFLLLSLSDILTTSFCIQSFL